MRNAPAEALSCLSLAIHQVSSTNNKLLHAEVYMLVSTLKCPVPALCPVSVCIAIVGFTPIISYVAAASSPTAHEKEEWEFCWISQETGPFRDNAMHKNVAACRCKIVFRQPGSVKVIPKHREYGTLVCTTPYSWCHYACITIALPSEYLWQGSHWLNGGLSVQRIF